MSAVLLTTQINPLSANAGNQFTQTVSSVISSPSSLSLSNLGAGSGASPSPNNQSGPGWATANNTPTGAARSPSGQKSWGLYFVIAAAAYFAFQKLR